MALVQQDKSKYIFFMPNQKIYFYIKRLGDNGIMCQSFYISVGSFKFKNFFQRKYIPCKYFGEKPINKHKKITFKFILDVIYNKITNKKQPYLKVLGFNQ